MLEPAYPSFPFKKFGATYEVRATRRDGGFILLIFHGKYAAARMVHKIIDGDDVEWKNTQTLVTSSGTKIYSPYLEQLVEHEDNKEEAAWQFGIPNSYYLAKFMREDAPSSSVSLPDMSKRDRTPIREPSERVERPDGLVPIAEITEELGIDPREARQILRKHATKPDWGWAWAKDQVGAIKKLLKDKRK